MSESDKQHWELKAEVCEKVNYNKRFIDPKCLNCETSVCDTCCPEYEGQHERIYFGSEAKRVLSSFPFGARIREKATGEEFIVSAVPDYWKLLKDEDEYYELRTIDAKKFYIRSRTEVQDGSFERVKEKQS